MADRSPLSDSRANGAAADLDPVEALASAVEKAGSQSGMARLLGIRQSTVSKWLSNSSRLPGEHVLTVEAATGVSRHDLRPDLYPRDDATIAPTADDDRLEGARP